MKLRQLEGFVAVYQERSISAAAERLQFTQSTLSCQLKELESRLRLSLFDRDTSGVTPTVAGDRLYTHALRLLRSLDETRRGMRDEAPEAVRAVSIGVVPTLSLAKLASVLAEHTGAYPTVQLTILERERDALVSGVAQGELDLAIVTAGPLSAGVIARHLGRDQECLVTNQPHPAPADLGQPLRTREPLKLVLPGVRDPRHGRISQYLAYVGAKIETVLEMDSLLGTRELVARSEWVAILPAAACQDRERLPRWRVYPLTAPALHIDYVLVSGATRVLPPYAVALGTRLQQQLLRRATDAEPIAAVGHGPCRSRHQCF